MKISLAKIFIHSVILIFIFQNFCCFNAGAAGDDKDSVSQFSKKRANHAALYSAVLPGAGQVFNKKYWKLPILYAGAGTLIYFSGFNNKYYKTFKQAYLYRTDGNPATVDEYPNYTNDDLSVRKDYYRRNRDLTYIFIGVLYMLNIIDAYVDSQMMDFDVSDKLSFHTSPGFEQIHTGEISAGLKLTFTLK